MKNYLNFEQDIKNLEIELDKLKDPYNQEGLSEVDTDKISKIQSEIDSKLSGLKWISPTYSTSPDTEISLIKDT